MRVSRVWAPLIVSAVLCITACSRSTLPAGLSDQEFWKLIETLSEPAGAFELSDTFVSNEAHVPDLIRSLRPSGGVYIGVGPEQNFSYIAALRPTMAFIVDIRRENLCLHLLYKALFALSTDRPDFVSRLFSRPRPPGLRSDAAVGDIFRAYDGVHPSQAQYEQTVTLIRQRLLTKRNLPLPKTDLAWIERAFKAFYKAGPDIHFWGSRSTDAVGPSYKALMTAEDFTGRPRSFLATEDAFGYVKALHARNLIVPVVGDFGGASAIRRVGDYARRHGAAVEAFYASNVGAYLTKEQSGAFCSHLATLPAAPRAWYIESNRMQSLASKLRACAP